MGDWLTGIAHEVLDDSIHCTGFEVMNENQDGSAGYPSFFQDPDDDWLHRLSEWSGLKPETVTFGTNATAYAQPSGTGIRTKLPARTDIQSPVYKACVVMGPGDIAQAHMADEWIEIGQLTKMKHVLEKWLSIA